MCADNTTSAAVEFTTDSYFADVSVSGDGGDTLVVSGELAAFDGDACTVTVLTGASADALDNEWTGLADAFAASDENRPFAFTLCEKDAAAARYVKPGAAVYVALKVTVGGNAVQTTAAQKVTTKNTATLADTNWMPRDSSSLTLTTACTVSDLGMTGKTSVSLWVSSDSGATWTKSGDEVEVEDTATQVRFDHAFSTWGETYSWKIRATNFAESSVAQYVPTATSSVKWLYYESKDEGNPYPGVNCITRGDWWLKLSGALSSSSTTVTLTGWLFGSGSLDLRDLTVDGFAKLTTVKFSGAVFSNACEMTMFAVSGFGDTSIPKGYFYNCSNLTSVAIACATRR